MPNESQWRRGASINASAGAGGAARRGAATSSRGFSHAPSYRTGITMVWKPVCRRWRRRRTWVVWVRVSHPQLPLSASHSQSAPFHSHSHRSSIRTARTINTKRYSCMTVAIHEQRLVSVDVISGPAGPLARRKVVVISCTERVEPKDAARGRLSL
ncbi:hypothetical protein EVAR_88503_1 [Eumeta japonica]|uniref:Uncharacterized protein n=1 Tax=Eumeta variegata TaxID=151549 RepID=A0A4C1XTL7_EUMVA|nr:hypothetical protein EVAR_88503_1 [Eumeta japonica]